MKKLSASDFVGQSFGRLTVTRFARVRNKPVVWCRCSCGERSKFSAYDVRYGESRSCGCLVVDSNIERTTTHGHTANHRSTKEYTAWRGMISRCRRKPLYIKNKIRVFPAWQKSFGAFLAHIGPSPGGEFSVDRIRNAEGYKPGNVRWATRSQQARNRSVSVKVTIDGKTMLRAEACDIYGISRCTARKRLAAGWSTEDAFKIPARPFQKRRKPHA